MGPLMSCGGNPLVKYVVTRIAQIYPEKSGSIEETNHYIHQAMALLAPFRPEKSDMMRMNMYLRNRQAGEIACMAAWALYKDHTLLPASAKMVNS